MKVPLLRIMFYPNVQCEQVQWLTFSNCTQRNMFEKSMHCVVQNLLRLPISHGMRETSRTIPFERIMEMQGNMEGWFMVARLVSALRDVELILSTSNWRSFFVKVCHISYPFSFLYCQLSSLDILEIVHYVFMKI